MLLEKLFFPESPLSEVYYVHLLSLDDKYQQRILLRREAHKVWWVDPDHHGTLFGTRLKS